MTSKIYEAYPELLNYDEEDKIWDYNRPDDDTPIEKLGRYEIIFDAHIGLRFYFYTEAVDSNEALYLFAQQHYHISYNKIVEVLEV